MPVLTVDKTILGYFFAPYTLVYMHLLIGCKVLSHAKETKSVGQLSSKHNGIKLQIVSTT